MAIGVLAERVADLPDSSGVPTTFRDEVSVIVEPDSETQQIRLFLNPHFFRTSSTQNIYYRLTRKVAGDADVHLLDGARAFVGDLPIPLWDTPGTTDPVTYVLSVAGRGYNDPGTPPSTRTETGTSSSGNYSSPTRALQVARSNIPSDATETGHSVDTVQASIYEATVDWTCTVTERQVFEGRGSDETSALIAAFRQRPGPDWLVNQQACIEGSGSTPWSCSVEYIRTTVTSGTATGRGDDAADAATNATSGLSCAGELSATVTGTRVIQRGIYSATVSWSRTVTVPGSPGGYIPSTGRVGLELGAYILAARGDQLQVPPFWAD